METAFLVLDKEEYKIHKKEYSDLMSKYYDNISIYFMEYETLAVRKCKNIPLIGKALHHIGYWFIAARNAIYLYRKIPTTIICVNSLVAIFLGLLNEKKHKIRIITYGFLFEPKNNSIYYSTRKKIAKRALRGINKAGVATRKEVETYKRIFGLENKFVFIPYGADYNAKPIEMRPENLKVKEYCISTGVSNRDYPTLISAYHKLQMGGKEISPLCIMTAPYCLTGLDLSGIETIFESRLSAIKALVRDAKYIVMSLKDGEIGVGHTILLLSLRENTPILVNRIPSIEDYVDESKVKFFKSGDIEDLSNKMLEMESLDFSNVQTRSFYEENYTEVKFIERLLNYSVNIEPLGEK